MKPSDKTDILEMQTYLELPTLIIKCNDTAALDGLLKPNSIMDSSEIAASQVGKELLNKFCKNPELLRHFAAYDREGQLLAYVQSRDFQLTEMHLISSIFASCKMQASELGDKAYDKTFGNCSASDNKLLDNMSELVKEVSAVLTPVVLEHETSQSGLTELVWNGEALLDALRKNVTVANNLNKLLREINHEVQGCRQLIDMWVYLVSLPTSSYSRRQKLVNLQEVMRNLY